MGNHGNKKKDPLKPLPGYDEVSIQFDDCLRSDFSEVLLQTLNSQVVWVNPRFSGREVDNDQERFRIINPSVSENGLFNDSDEEVETDMSFIGPRAERHASSGQRLGRQRTKMISIQMLKPPPEEAQNITSSTEPDEPQTGTRDDHDLDEEDDDDEDRDSYEDLSVVNSAGFSSRSLDWRWIGDRNELEEVVPLRRMTGDEDGSSEYDAETLGRSDLFWPIMTAEERKMLGAPSRLDLASDEVDKDPEPSTTDCSIVVHPPTPGADVSEATSAVIAGPSRYRWGPVVEPVTSNNGNLVQDLSVEVIAEARPPRRANSRDEIPQMVSAGTSTAELEEIVAAEFPQGLSLHRCSIV